MKSTTYFFCVFFITVFSTSVFADKIRVNNTLVAPNQVDFNEIQEAVDAANIGDTIYVEGSGIPYQGGIEINKKLTIIGPGYLLNQPHTLPSLCKQLSATIGENQGITLYAGASGSYITGLSFVSNAGTPVSILIDDASQISIVSNRLERIRVASGTSNQPSNISGIEIIRNLIRDDIDFGSYLSVGNLIIRNNLIGDDIEPCCSSGTSTYLSGSILYNTIKGTLWANGCEIGYNLTNYISVDPAQNGNIYNNRLGFPNATITNYPTNVYNSFVYNNWDFDTDDWALDEIDDTDTEHGAHNGFDPINPQPPAISLANLPLWPAIYECDVQPCGDDFLQVLFKVLVVEK